MVEEVICYQLELGKITSLFLKKPTEKTRVLASFPGPIFEMGLRKSTRNAADTIDPTYVLRTVHDRLGSVVVA